MVFVVAVVVALMLAFTMLEGAESAIVILRAAAVVTMMKTFGKIKINNGARRSLMPPLFMSMAAAPNPNNTVVAFFLFAVVVSIVSISSSNKGRTSMSLAILLQESKGTGEKRQTLILTPGF